MTSVKNKLSMIFHRHELDDLKLGDIFMDSTEMELWENQIPPILIVFIDTLCLKMKNNVIPGITKQISIYGTRQSHQDTGHFRL